MYTSREKAGEDQIVVPSNMSLCIFCLKLFEIDTFVKCVPSILSRKKQTDGGVETS